MKQRIPSLDEYIFEEKINDLSEALKESGLEFAAHHGLEKSLRFMSYKDYKDNANHKPLFSLLHYESGWPTAGLRPDYFGDAVPGDKFKEVAKSASDYLKTGKASAPIIEFIAYIYTDAAPGGRSQGPISDAIERIKPEFNPENKDLPVMKDTLTKLIEVLKSWSTGTAAARLNLAIAVNKECNYSAYAGSDFEKVYRMVIEGLRKNKIKLQPDSKIVINKDNTHLSDDTISNSIGFSSIEINRWRSVVTVKINGKEFVAGTFDNESAYGRY